MHRHSQDAKKLGTEPSAVEYDVQYNEMLVVPARERLWLLALLVTVKCPEDVEAYKEETL